MAEEANNILRTIILDDSPSFRGFLRELLARFEFIRLVAETDSAENALELVKDHIPDLVLVDIRLPGMGGFEFAEVLKSRLPMIRVIFITLYGDKLYSRKARGLGYPCIQKSSILEELPEQLEKIRSLDTH